MSHSRMLEAREFEVRSQFQLMERQSGAGRECNFGTCGIL
jgi:hypothetical protein